MENNWIKVEDRLPPSNGYVLTWGTHENVQRDEFVRFDTHYMWSSKVAGKHTDLRKWPVTHWQPLPEPPS